MTAILWLRRDLRVHDHPALIAARQDGERLVPVFCLDERLLQGRHSSGPRTQFMLECLADLRRSLRARGSDLVIRRGAPERELPALAREVGAQRVHLTRDVGPFARRRDERVAAALGRLDIGVRAHPGLFALDDPAALCGAGGSPYQVFTPFHRAWSAAPRRPLAPTPRRLPPLPPGVRRGRMPSLGELGLRRELAAPLRGGERAGRARMLRFLRGPIARYGQQRNMLADEATSRLSAYLHFGCVSARELEDRAGARAGADEFLRQLCWRDFYAHVLHHAPQNAHSEHQERYRGRLAYRDAQQDLQAWREGRTGYPLVDAAMRQLAREGFIHNRARLVAGSFLTKDLGIDWRWGERWFMRLLLDGDEASNNGNWQWIASVGADPQPVSRRILSPTRQQARFDPDGAYVRRHVPELRLVPDRYLAEPWRMPPEQQRRARCVIGRDYPAPIVEHAAARREALRRYGTAAGR